LKEELPSATEAIVEPKSIVEPEPEESKEESGKYMLLNRLFRFVRQKDPLNAVLSGYFSKLVTLLINRKQKLLIPFVFDPSSDVIDCLLYHVYQKSISELLNKLLTIQENDFEGELAKNIKAK
jgi:hypothetical protein